MTACRFAPSPNGPLHLGHAYSALRNAVVAERLGGRFLLRIEDIDTARCSPVFEAGIEADLAWLGLSWERPVRRQSQHGAAYGAALDRLHDDDLLFPCFCTRGDIARATAGRTDWPRDPDGAPLYPGTCRALPERERARRIADGQPHALRLDAAAAAARLPGALTWIECGEGDRPLLHEASAERWGDAVLRRKDLPGSYHVAVVVDDAAQNITDVVRGADLLEATSLHRLLQTLLGLPAPRYHHHRLVLDREGGKLSKSRGAPALADLRASGVSPGDVRAMALDRLSPG